MTIGDLAWIALAVGVVLVVVGALLIWFGLWLWERYQDRRARAVLPDTDPYEYPDVDPDEDLDDRPDELLADEGRGRHHLRPDDTVRLDPVEAEPLANPVRPYMRRRQP